MNTLRRRKKANGLKREINAICFLRNLKPLFYEEGRCGQNFGGLWLMLVWNSETVSIWFVLCLSCALVFCHTRPNVLGGGEETRLEPNSQIHFCVEPEAEVLAKRKEPPNTGTYPLSNTWRLWGTMKSYVTQHRIRIREFGIVLRKNSHPPSTVSSIFKAPNSLHFVAPNLKQISSRIRRSAHTKANTRLLTNNTLWRRTQEHRREFYSNG